MCLNVNLNTAAKLAPAPKIVQQIFQEGFGTEEEKQPRLERLLYCLEKKGMEGQVAEEE